MTFQISIQQACQTEPSPTLKQLRSWCETVLTQQKLSKGEICIRLVDETESANLNQQYRNKDGATNVLSFPSDIPDVVDSSLLGDLIICSAIVNQEAKIQKKTRAAHWAHMITHGTLHLLGFDHIQAHDAEIMEALEIELLKQLGFANPY